MNEELESARDAAKHMDASEREYAIMDARSALNVANRIGHPDDRALMAEVLQIFLQADGHHDRTKEQSTSRSG
jgi:hypothetical protein